MDKEMSFSKGVKISATIIALLVALSGLIAGVADTRSRVTVLERDTQKLGTSLDHQVEKTSVVLERIQEGVHRIDTEQRVMTQQMKTLINRLDRKED